MTALSEQQLKTVKFMSRDLNYQKTQKLIIQPLAQQIISTNDKKQINLLLI